MGKGSGKDSRKSVGMLGEEIAADFLKKAGLKVLARNYRCKAGEIDIIAKDKKTVVFVEVKTRRTADFGLPQYAVTEFKKRQISKAALTWLGVNSMLDSPARFDVVAIMIKDGIPEIEHIKNAFDLAY
ncbi:MAG: YraN family protein [Desulfuromonadales bacterium]|nr:YraN family protein [Desulfuromonadales bacterium]